MTEELAPGATPDSLTRAVREVSVGERAVIAVGHQPDCTGVAAALTGEPEPAFPPATSVAISL